MHARDGTLARSFVARWVQRDCPDRNWSATLDAIRTLLISPPPPMRSDRIGSPAPSRGLDESFHLGIIPVRNELVQSPPVRARHGRNGVGGRRADAQPDGE